MSNVYQIEEFRHLIRLKPGLRSCGCDAARYRHDFLARELKRVRMENRQPGILRLEGLHLSPSMGVGKPGAGWDFIYSEDLLSHLPQAAAAQAVRLAFAHLRPGGRLLFANPSLCRGYAECAHCEPAGVVFRTELEMAELSIALPSFVFSSQAIFRDARGLNVYLELYRAPAVLAGSRLTCVVGTAI